MSRISVPVRIGLLILVLGIIGIVFGPRIVRRVSQLARQTIETSQVPSPTQPAVAGATVQPAAAAPTSPAVAPVTPPTTNATTNAATNAAMIESQAIYTNTLADGWQDWSWGSTADLAGITAREGKSIGLTYTSGWAGFYLHAGTPVKTRGFDTLRFWANGGATGGQTLRLCNSTQCAQASNEFTLVADTWTQIDVPLAKLGARTNLTDLIWQNMSPNSQPTLYIDNIALIATAPANAVANAAAIVGPALSVDAGAQRHPISPLIYGINFPDEALAQELKLPIQRWGGNSTTRYNWKNDTSNKGSDWFFENYPNDNANPDALPKGSETDKFVEQAKRTGTQPLLTIPMTGWTPKSREISCGFSVELYGEQQQADSSRPCGNGLKADGSPLTGNNPQDTSIAIDEQFVKDWIAYLQRQFGTASQGGVGFFNLDNEPFLWHTTHRDVWPNPLTYDELRDLTYRYAAAVKQADPAAQTLGPAEWGWTGYFYSAKDAAEKGNWWNKAPDRNAHSGTPFAAWYLQQMQAYEQQHGIRILDYFDLHFYPQSQGVALQGAGDDATQALRLRSTRALWDASYTDESWINEPVKLIPRMREWVDQNYPGTKTSLTEYNWGALDDINGALAQADILGIFGRERLDLATLWAHLGNDDPWAYAFRMYRNYDAQGGRFGETSIAATSADQEKLAVYAAERAADGALTVMVINKSNDNLSSALTLNGSQANQATVYRYSPANLDQITKEADAALANGTLNTTFPASSITLFVLR